MGRSMPTRSSKVAVLVDGSSSLCVEAAEALRVESDSNRRGTTQLATTSFWMLNEDRLGHAAESDPHNSPSDSFPELYSFTQALLAQPSLLEQDIYLLFSQDRNTTRAVTEAASHLDLFSHTDKK